MDSEWPTAALGTLAANFDKRRVPLSAKQRAERPGSFPYHGATGVMDYVDDFLFEGLHLLVAEDGSVEDENGKPVLQLVDGKFWVNNHAHVLRAASSSETKYLYYALATIHIRPYMSGSVQAKLSQANMNRIPVPFPPRRDREGIVTILGALDDKIELNRRMSETLEEMARALFKAWFVDFTDGPAEGGSAPARAGWPAEGEGRSTVGAEFDVTMGQSPPGSTYNTGGDGMPFYQGRADFGALIPTRRVYCTAPTRLARSGDTLLSVRAPVGDVNVAVEDCAIGRGVAALRHKSGSSVYTYFFARSIRDVLDTFNGEGTVFGSISKKALLGLPCNAPTSVAVADFDRVGAPVLDRVRLLFDESSTLGAIRDTLLPKLISGELRVPDAERLVSEVA